MTYGAYFRNLTGYDPYPFQEAIGHLLVNRQSLIFRAPTGAGKTWATVAPFLYSHSLGARIADRLIYALPLRSLASSLHSSVCEAMERTISVRQSAKARAYPSDHIYCSLQMGGEKNDPFLEGDLIFCTIDQVLSGYLMMPLSLPDRLGNIVAGALAGSFLIFDEVHLLDSKIAMGTVIEMLIRFRGLIQFVFMTATMSDESMRWLANKLGAQVAEIPETEVRDLPVQRFKHRVWRWRQEALGTEAVIAAHRAGRTLAIVNQVDRAQELYTSLEAALAGSQTKLACLHSRFFPADRTRTENKLQSWFGRSATESDVILVTTQVVEAGMDISADHILTELAPMNALIQRAGRTARYESRCEGAVTVFEIEKELPYSDAAAELAATRSCLRSLSIEGENVDFKREQDWIETVHGEGEKAALAAFRRIERRSDVEQAILTGDRGNLSALVRDVDAVNILLSEVPQTVRFDGTRWPELLSIPRSSTWRLRELIERGAGGIFTAVSLEDESGPLRFKWPRVENPSQLRGCWLVALGPQIARYSEDVGLQIGVAGEEVPVRYSALAPILNYQYFYESWTDHTRRVIGQARRMAGANSWGAKKIDEILALSPGTMENLVELTAALHDIGKLSVKWQAEAWQYETGRTGRLRTQCVAHTTKRPGDTGPKLPSHAVEGALASMAVLDKLCPRAAMSVARAIARHHSVRSYRCGDFELSAEACDLVREFVGPDGALVSAPPLFDRSEFGQELDSLWEERKWWIAYAYLVRRLRLADQAGTAEGVQESASG